MDLTYNLATLYSHCTPSCAEKQSWCPVDYVGSVDGVVPDWSGVMPGVIDDGQTRLKQKRLKSS